MGLAAIQESFERIESKREEWLWRFRDSIQKMDNEIEIAKVLLGNPVYPVDQRILLTKLNNKIHGFHQLFRLEDPWPELKVCVEDHIDLLNTKLISNMSKAYMSNAYDQNILNRIIAIHFLRENMFDVFDCFVEEVGNSGIYQEEALFKELEDLLDAFRVKNFEPVLQWVSLNKDALKNGPHMALKLQFELHRLKLLEILRSTSSYEALQYGQTHIRPLYESSPDQFGGLMDCIIYAGSLETSPFAYLLDPIYLMKVEKELFKMFCDCREQPYKGYLDVSFVAGAEALPTLLRLVDMAELKGENWYIHGHVTDPLPLKDEFRFHSIVLCPNSAHLCTQANPPLLLTCGHVICVSCHKKYIHVDLKMFLCPHCLEFGLYEYLHF